MVCVLKESPDAFNMVAPDCGSFTLVSRGTSKRSPINPLGYQAFDFVARGNGTISRWFQGSCVNQLFSKWIVAHVFF